MQENQEIVGTNVGNEVTTPEPQVTGGVNPDDEKRYSKNDIVKLMQRRVERSHKSFFSRYGVKDLNELDSLFDKTKQFDNMSNEYGAIQLRNSDLLKENAFIKNNINPDKYDDINTYFKGKGVDFSEEGLKEALMTHTEWLKPEPTKTTITTFGTEHHSKPIESEDAKQKRIFGI